MYTLTKKLDYMISRVVHEMDYTSLSIYKELCDLDHDLNQTTFILLTQKFPIVRFIITGQRKVLMLSHSFNAKLFHQHFVY